MPDPLAHLHWGDEKRSIDLRDKVDKTESPALAFHAPSNTYAVAQGSKIELRDASWAFIGTIHEGAAAAPERITFDPTGQFLVAAYSIQSERKRDELLRIFEVHPDAPTSGSQTSRSELVDAVVQKTEQILQDLAGWTGADASAVREDLVNSTRNTITSAYMQRDINNKVVMKASLTSFQSLPFSNDGRFLYALTGRNEVSLTDVHTKDVLFKLSHPLLPRTPQERKRGGWVNNEAIMWVGQSPDDRLFATVSWDATVVLWDAQTGAMVHQLKGPSNQNWAGVFGSDSSWFATGCGVGKVYVWDTKTGQLLATLEGFKGWIRALAVSSDGKRMAAGSEGGSIIEFDTSSWTKIWDYNVGKLDPDDESWSMAEFTNLQYAKQDTRLIAKISDERLYVFSERGEALLRIDPVYGDGQDLGNGWSQRAFVLPGEEEFGCLGGDGKLRFWPL